MPAASISAFDREGENVPAEKNRRSQSILHQMLFLLLMVLLVHLGIYLFVLTRGGVVEETEQNALYILSERTANRKLYLENEMVQRWSNTEEGETGVYTAMERVLGEAGAQASQLLTDRELSQRAVDAAIPALVEMLRRNGVTGSFLVLDCPGDEGNYPGFYVRDYDPANYNADNKDLLLERGLPSAARVHNISMDSYWSAFFGFEDQGADSAQFFYRPMEAARALGASQEESGYYACWTGRFALSELDREVVAYSIPLIWEDGTVVGVMGVDVTLDYLISQLHYDELGSDKAGAYFLGISRDGGVTYEMVCSSGPNFRSYFGHQKILETASADGEGIVTLEHGAGGQTLYGAVQELRLYNANTPFENDRWALIGIMEGDHLFTFTHRLQRLLLLSGVASLALGAVLVALAARTISRPVIRLVGHLQRSNPDKPIHLPRIHIDEIDTLSEAIENLSNSAVESAARISKIIAMTKLPIGVFEYQKESGRVFCSQSLFELLEQEENGDAYLSVEDFRAMLSPMEPGRHEEDRTLFRLPDADGGERWLQLFYREEGHLGLGAFLDVSKDMEAKQRIEYERDFDILTALYNRRAFDQRLEQLLQEKRTLGVAAMLMFDLDNLKYVNDTYGHDYGDRYIQVFAKTLEYFYQYRAVVGRRSGDEFNVFLYGFVEKEALRIALKEFQKVSEECILQLPNGEKLRVRASGGLAWYPDDSREIEALIRMADFAMYDVKHSEKGAFREFDREAYQERAIFLEGLADLDRLFDQRLVRYALQPVVSAADGSIYGYEMLMRPQIEQLQDLNKLFRLAKAQSKLLRLEELTWFAALETFQGLERAGQLAPGALAFINSIGSQVLTPWDLSQLEERYGNLLSRVVVELTEEEEAGGELAHRKKMLAQGWRAKLALDDYGSGFNSEAVLVDVAPDMVKVDISLVRGIDADPDRLTLVQNLIHYAQKRDILVVAEGVETRQELETLIACKVDYLQGFYLARPSYKATAIPEDVQKEIKRLHMLYSDKD